MPTNRPFFANFFSAFRAHSSPAFQAKGSPTSSTVVSPGSLVAAAHVSTTTATVTSSSTAARTITTRSSTEQQSQAAGLASPSKTTNTPPLPFSTNPSTHRYAPPLSKSPATTSNGGVHAHTTPANPNLSMSPPGPSTPMTRGRPRRGSDSSNSSAGFMDALGPEKWYIGGRSPGGEETFYKLGLVTGGAGKRVRSLDRLSL